jgi:HEXXH motif-containing protein
VVSALTPSKTNVSELGFVPLPHWLISEICAGQGSTRAITLLRGGQYGLRKLGLLALLECEEITGVDHAWTILEDAERRDARAVEDVLMAPAVGVWLSRALRQVFGVPPAVTELGWLHCVVAAAALKSNVDCIVRTPVTQGEVVLPTVGRFSLPKGTTASQVELRVTAPAVSARTVDGWVTLTLEPAVSHRSTWQGMTLDASVDFLSPYRRFCAPEPADVVGHEERTRWTGQLDAAWRLLTEWHPGYAEELGAARPTIVPLPAEDETFAATSSAAFGGIAMSAKRSALEFAEALVHELAHSKLNALMDLVELSLPGPHSFLYAPWRDDSRPISGLLHGVYAFMSVVEFWAVHKCRVPSAEIPRAEFAFHHRRVQLNRVIETVYSHPALTDLGREFVGAVEKRLAAHSLTEVSPDVVTTVGRLVDDHGATWRMRHIRPCQRSVERLTEAWTAGVPAVVEPSNDDPARDAELTGEPTRRSTLVRSRLLDRNRFERLAGDDPDSAFARGEHEPAATGYLDRIRADRGDLDAWIGYGLAARSRTLLSRPELVHAVHDRLAATTGSVPDPGALAAWFDEGGAGT